MLYIHLIHSVLFVAFLVKLRSVPPADAASWDVSAPIFAASRVVVVCLVIMYSHQATCPATDGHEKLVVRPTLSRVRRSLEQRRQRQPFV